MRPLVVGGTSLVCMALALSGPTARTALANPARCSSSLPEPATETDLSELPLEELLDVRTTVATTKETTVFNTPSTVAVIDRETIERYNFRTLTEAVNILAGFATWKTTSWSELPTSRWILQAHYPDKILVMVNGVATWTPVLGETRLDRINIDDVERIEVLRGPSSVLYGTNAYTGAINVVLRCQPHSDAVSGTAYAGMGIKYAHAAGGNLMLSEGDLMLFAGAGGYDEEGDLRQFVDADGTNGYYRDFRRWQDFVFNLEVGDHSILISGYRSERTKLGKDPTFLEGWGDPEFSQGYLANYTFTHKLSEDWELRSGTTFDWSQRIFSREAGFDLRTSVIGWRGAAFVKSYVTLPHDLTLDVGIDGDYRRSEEYWIFREQTQEHISDSNLRDRHLYEASAYAQLGATVGDLGLLAGTRFTFNQGFGQNLSSRVSAVYRLNETNSLKLIVGQSFRAPTLFELYFLDDGRSTSGDPDLDPETSTSFEVAYLTAFHGLFVQGLAYHALYDGNIHRTRVPEGTPLADGDPAHAGGASMYVNAPRFSATGLELELTYREGPISSFATYGFVLGNDDEGDFNFDYVPHHKAVAGVALSWHGILASVSGIYLSPMHTPVVDEVDSKDIGHQVRFDANLGFSQTWHGKRVRHTLSAKNLTGARTEVPEYVDLDLRSIPFDQLLRLSYMLTVDF